MCKASPRHDRGRGHQRLYTATAENRVAGGDQTRGGGNGSGDYSCCGRNRWWRMRETLGGNGSSNCSSSSSSGIGVDVACQRGRRIAGTAIRHSKQGGSKRWDGRHLSTAGDGSGSGGSVIGSVGNEGCDGSQVMVEGSSMSLQLCPRVDQLRHLLLDQLCRLTHGNLTPPHLLYVFQ